MKNIGRIVSDWVWQLPQNLLGVIWKNIKKDSIITPVIKHECGNVKQSKMLGPLYLIVIGVPSILHAWLNDYIGCDEESGYSHFYTEKCADKLMGINT